MLGLFGKPGGASIDTVVAEEIWGGSKIKMLAVGRNGTGNSVDKTNLLGGSVLTVEGPSILRVTGEYSIDVGTGDDAGTAQINVSGSLVLGGSKSLRLITQGSLTLSAGESSLEISPEGIRITAGRVEIAGMQALSLAGKGPTLSLGEEAELAAKKIRMLSTDAK